MRSHKIAHGIGTEVRKKLGQGWGMRVWENLGWHVEWTNGAVQLHYSEFANRGLHFWAMVGDADGSCGGLPWLMPGKNRHYTDPLSAIKAACRYAEKQLNGRIHEIHLSVFTVRTLLGKS